MAKISRHLSKKLVKEFGLLAVILLLMVSTCQTRSVHNLAGDRVRRDASGVKEGSGTQPGWSWKPGGSQSLEEYLKCHGMPPKDCDAQKQKLQDLKNMIASLIKVPPPSGPGGMLAQDSPPGLALDATLDGCMLLTKEQLTGIIARMENFLAISRLRSNTSSTTSSKDSSAGAGKRRRKRSLINFGNSPSSKWSLPIVYKFDGAHSSSEQVIIRNAFQHWMDNTCVRFTEVPLNQEVKDNHVILTAGGSGCYSYVGKVPYMPQQVNLQSSCLYRFGTPVHEIGHTLGIWHTQMRTDRDQWIDVLWENIVPAYASQFYNYIDMDSQGVPYDLGSVMHYSSLDGVSVNGKYTMVAKEPFYQRNMGQRTGLSFGDIKMINKAYCKDICRTPTAQPCQHSGYQDPNRCERCICPDGFGGDFCQSVAPSENAQCGGEIQLPLGSNYTITSPGYDSPQYYNSKQSCNWWVKAPAGKRIQLVFQDEFAIYCDYDSCYHWLEVKYKADLSLQGGRFCCYERPNAVVTSQSNEMMLVFRSNVSIEFYRAQRGFKAVLQIVDGDGNVVTSRDSQPPSTTLTTTTTTATSTTRSTTITSTTPTTTTRKIQSVSGNLLFYCSFEVGVADPFCGMIQDTTDQFDWTINSGPTPSDPTGPDYAYDQYYYIYIEASTPRQPNDEARLYFPALPQYSGDLCIDFYYHMYGFHINALEIVSIDGSTRTLVWSRYGDKGNRWYRGFVDISYKPGLRLMIIGRRGQEFSGDIGLDKIQLTAGKCL